MARRLLAAPRVSITSSTSRSRVIVACRSRGPLALAFSVVLSCLGFVPGEAEAGGLRARLQAHRTRRQEQRLKRQHPNAFRAYRADSYVIGATADPKAVAALLARKGLTDLYPVLTVDPATGKARAIVSLWSVSYEKTSLPIDTKGTEGLDYTEEVIGALTTRNPHAAPVPWRNAATTVTALRSDDPDQRLAVLDIRIPADRPTPIEVGRAAGGYDKLGAEEVRIRDRRGQVDVSVVELDGRRTLTASLHRPTALEKVRGAVAVTRNVGVRGVISGMLRPTEYKLRTTLENHRGDLARSFIRAPRTTVTAFGPRDVLSFGQSSLGQRLRQLDLKPTAISRSRDFSGAWTPPEPERPRARRR